MYTYNLITLNNTYKYFVELIEYIEIKENR